MFQSVSATTDIHGLVTLDGKNPRDYVSYIVEERAGYYFDGGGEYHFKKATAGRWEPWNPSVEIKLRPILNPVAMYARLKKLVVPELGKPFGVDLMVGDWVAPYGKGAVADFIFQVDRQPSRTVKSGPYQRDVKLFDATMTVGFASKGDGLLIASNTAFADSAFRLARYAPENGYEPGLVRRAYRESAQSNIVINPPYDRDFFFRVRTVELNGRILSALYGKIAKDIGFDAMHSDTATIVFKYYLNPTPNDRNMEFDPKRNLFKNLSALERVNEP
jgi:hypothetical protein